MLKKSATAGGDGRWTATGEAARARLGTGFNRGDSARARARLALGLAATGASAAGRARAREGRILTPITGCLRQVRRAAAESAMQSAP